MENYLIPKMIFGCRKALKWYNKMTSIYTYLFPPYYFDWIWREIWIPTALHNQSDIKRHVMLPGTWMIHAVICHSDGYIGCVHMAFEIPDLLFMSCRTFHEILWYMSPVTQSPFVCIIFGFICSRNCRKNLTLFCSLYGCMTFNVQHDTFL